MIVIKRVAVVPRIKFNSHTCGNPFVPDSSATVSQCTCPVWLNYKNDSVRTVFGVIRICFSAGITYAKLEERAEAGYVYLSGIKNRPRQPLVFMNQSCHGTIAQRRG